MNGQGRLVAVVPVALRAVETFLTGVGLEVSGQVAFFAEDSPALRAGVALLLGMDVHVLGERGLVRIAPAAFCTRVGLGSGVKPLMDHQRQFVSEILATFGAPKFFLGSVGFLVPGKLPFLCKSFPALVAGKGPLARVGSFVPHQLPFLCEALSAHLALKGLLTRVDSPMDNKLYVVAETLPTLRTFERPLSSVGSLVHH